MLLTNLATLVLAGFVGYAVISKVPNTLHTPLMSGTNAIHGIVVLGGIVLLATGAADDALTKALLTVAVVFGTINVVGGFLVTDRMLEMFKPRERTAHDGAARSSRRQLRELLYIASSGLFIFGLYGLTGPTTAVRGNRIAAAGMAVAVVATLLRPHVDNWELIVLGVVAGTAVGVPAARRVQMTQMPQMVALFNGVGGGAVALIAWAEFRSSGGYADDPTYVAIFSVFAAIVGSISFWGSTVAFAKLQELIRGRPITAGRLQTPLNALVGLVAAGAAAALVAGAGTASV